MKTPLGIRCFGGLVAALALSSCVMPYPPGPMTSQGGVVGAVTGAAAGAIIGNQSDRPLEGAAIGGVIGAIAGSALGNANDQYYGSAYYPPPRTYVYRQSYCPPPVVYQSYSYAPGYRYGYGYNSCAPRYYSHHHHYCR
ncbi:MAG: hypothetical protein JNM99_18420 [Verrucomicrobiaceae bacterium]|nr:hypothetical protein [Verrucomicrobiaceae bacterium]